MKGLGGPQLEARKQTGERILTCIKMYPGIHVRGLISKTGINPNSTIRSIRHLYQNKKILKKSESKLFFKIKCPKNATCYVFHYSELEQKQTEKVEKLKNEFTEILKEFKKFHDRQFEQYKPTVKKFANSIKLMIDQKDESMLLKIRNRLNAKKINPSMIGFYIFKEIEKFELKNNDEPWAPEFYFKMLPNNLCSIKFENEEDFKNFCKKHFEYDPLKFIHSDSIKKFPFALIFVLKNLYSPIK